MMMGVRLFDSINDSSSSSLIVGALDFEEYIPLRVSYSSLLVGLLVFSFFDGLIWGIV